jgi:hypothetical protein
MNLDFWIDPGCPWCWLTSRWVVEVAPHRDVHVRWRSISLFMKNNPAPESAYYIGAIHTHGLLRVIESVRAAEGDEPIGRLYEAMGEQMHHEGARFVPAAKFLADVGLDLSHAEAFDDPAWDPVIRASMDEGLGLAGDNVGTPLLGFDSDTGQRVGWFGPVISRRLVLPDALKLWDGLMTMAGIDAMWELKRTRNEAPNFALPGE